MVILCFSGPLCVGDYLSRDIIGRYYCVEFCYQAHKSQTIQMGGFPNFFIYFIFLYLLLL